MIWDLRHKQTYSVRKKTVIKKLSIIANEFG